MKTLGVIAAAGFAILLIWALKDAFTTTGAATAADNPATETYFGISWMLSHIASIAMFIGIGIGVLALAKAGKKGA